MRTSSFFVGLFVATAALAAPRWVRLSLPGQAAATSIVVAWNDDAGTSGEVQFGLAGGPLDSTATGVSQVAKGDLGVVHEVLITGLQPSTKYAYRVGGGGAWSAAQEFTTAPADGCEPFTFIAAGDHRSDDDFGPNPKWASILSEMAATGALFIVETGDLVKDGEEISQWRNHMEMGASEMGQIALMPSFGNHDADDVTGNAAAFNQLFALPTNASTGSEDFYAFEYGHAVFVALSTATFDDAAGLAQQAQWLDETLEAHSSKLWKFVYVHHPVHTSYVDLGFADLNHPPDERGQNSHWVPIFDKHHVDVVFAGHNHFYERFAPMKGGQVASSPAQGTIYVTTGGAGAFTYDEIDLFGTKISPMDVICGEGFLGFSGKAKGSQLCSGKHHFMELTLDGGELKAVVLATSAQNFSDSAANVEVIDSFTIVKPMAEALCAPPVPDEEPVVVEAEADTTTTTPDGSAAAEPSADVGGPVAEDTGAQDAGSAAAEPAGADIGLEVPTPPSPDVGPTTATADAGGGTDDDGGGCSTRPGVRPAPWVLALAGVALFLRRRAR